MTKKIELGRLHNNTDKPVFFKEKILDNGEIKPRLYQRKEIASIKGFFERAKTQIRYSAEDFAAAHNLTGLSKVLGFKSLKKLHATANYLNNPQEPSTYKRVLSTGVISEKDNTSMKELLKGNYIEGDFEFYSDNKYSDEDFIEDFKHVTDRKTFTSRANSEQLGWACLHIKSMPKWKFLTSNDLKGLNSNLEDLKKLINEEFVKKGTPQDVRQRFMRKLDETHKKINSLKLSKAEMKEWCIEQEAARCDSGQGYRGKTAEPDSTVLKNIRIFFSDSIWISDEKRKAAQAELQKHFKTEEARNKLPNSIEQTIFGNHQLTTQQTDESQTQIQNVGHDA